MAIRFFQEFAKEQKAEENEKRTGSNCRWYLIQFAIGFSLTLTDPLLRYDDRRAVLYWRCSRLCFRFARWNYFRRILATGILSVLLSVLPMAAGVAMGKGLQGSLYWGLNVVISGRKQDDETDSRQILWWKIQS
ncbi:MAG: hypothetical protein ACLRIL_08490 [Fusicatenibacter saccharivorans]